MNDVAEARSMVLRLAQHMDAVRDKCAEMGSGLGSLNQLAWLGEMACRMGDTLRAALASPAASQAPQWRHKARGTLYTVIGHAELQNASGAALREGSDLVIYRGEDGKLWARLRAEFEDGRFEPISAPDGQQ